MESYAINLVLPKLQNGTKRNVNSLQLEILLFALILGLLRGMLGRSFLLELPPRARRILHVGCGHTRHMGTTSACAENTGAFGLPAGSAWNYLRVRGEYLVHRLWLVSESELPPRARRIPYLDISHLCDDGTTSACAENTLPLHMQTYTPRNYLRVRGEYLTCILFTPPLAELPPRARRILNH